MTAVVAAILASQAASLTQIDDAIAMGRRCYAPIVKIPARANDFDVFIESPLARIALFAATAKQMMVPFDARAAERLLVQTYRIWADYPDDRPHTASVNKIEIASDRDQRLEPIAVQTTRFFLGRVPSHGIIEPLRYRPGESTFADVPPAAFTVLLRTTAGTQRYRVTAAARRQLLRVCNGE